jgi:3,4-dihydroxy-2-butanone 4-phosphate synthase
MACESWTHQRYFSVWVWTHQRYLSVSPGLIRDTCLCESWTHQRYLSVWVLTDKNLWWVQDSHRQVSLMSPELTQTSISDESRTHTDMNLWWVQDSHWQVSLMSPGLTQTSISHQRFLSVWVLDSSEILVCVSPGLITCVCNSQISDSKLAQTSISDESRTHTDKYLWWVHDSHRQVSLMSPGLTQTSISAHIRKYYC